MISFTPSPFSSVCFLSGFGMKYVYQSFFYYIFLLIATLLSQPHVSYLFCSVLLLRWGGCSQWWSPRNTENQQNSETLNHHNDESWTKTQHWIDSVLRAHQWKIVNICSAPVLLSLVTFLFHFLLWFVVICVCFPSRTNFPLKVSRRTCRYCFNFYLHYLIITISFIQYVFIDTYVLLELAFFLE